VSDYWQGCYDLFDGSHRLFFSKSDRFISTLPAALLNKDLHTFLRKALGFFSTGVEIGKSISLSEAE